MPKVTITDGQGKTCAQFDGNTDESVATQAQDAGAPIPLGCGVGACRTCIGTVEKGLEWIDPEAVSPQQIPTEENEVLTCVCGIKGEAPDDAEIKICCQNV